MTPWTGAAVAAPHPEAPLSRRMWIHQLGLANFRSYRRLALELAPGPAVFCGRNGQGKSNLLEAVHVLATTKSPRTSAERELVAWQPQGDEQEEPAGLPAFARVEGRLRRREGEVHLEVLYRVEPPEPQRSASAEPEAPRPAAAEPGAVGEVAGAISRSITVNGLPTRAAELVGQLTVVYFSPEDVGLAGGPPSGRRRYLDLANAQVAPLYLRALQQYNRVLLQRNQVLREIRARRQPVAALEPWTEQLVRTGVFVLRQRARMLVALDQLAAPIFRDLTAATRDLRLVYRSTVLDRTVDPRRAQEQADLAACYRARLEQLGAREVEQAVSLVGPHRDDFAFVLGGVDLTSYGSRGEQRLAVLTLKLAEAEWMQAEMGEMPVLLLDDVMSELDPEKRRYVLDRVGRRPPGADAGHQVWITTADEASFPPAFLAAAQRYNIDAGSVRRA